MRESEKLRETSRARMSSVGATKPHAVCIPFPAQGHINPMLKLAKLLHFKGFHITFIHTDPNHNQILNAAAGDNDGLSPLEPADGFRFETVPESLPPSSDPREVCLHLRTKFLAPFREMLTRLDPVTCIISDAVMSFTLEIATEVGIPDVFFNCGAACGAMACIHLKEVMERGLVPLKSESDLSNGYLNTPVDWIMGMKRVRLRDFPSFIRTTDADDIGLNFVKDEMRGSFGASAIILNTFDDLEGEVLDAMSRMLPPIYTIGPLPLLSRELRDNRLEYIGSNLLKEDSSCLEWLKGRENASVLYLNFGSSTFVTSEQLTEFAWGLANSGVDFLWVIRPDFMNGDSAILPKEFSTQTSGRGLLASWCPQEEVLMHPSIGGFLTHCGWNSMIESISCGVPMICWPFFADQQTNCRYACAEWGIGMEIDQDVKRKEVERLIRELMNGENAKEMKAKAIKWKERAVKATEQGGKSFQNLDRLINEVLLAKREFT